MVIGVIFGFCNIIIYLNLALIVPFFICCFCYRCCYIIIYAYCNEAYNTQLRSTGIGVNNAISRFGAIFVPVLILDLFNRNHLLPYLVFFVLSILIFILAYILPYETVDKNLDFSHEHEERTA